MKLETTKHSLRLSHLSVIQQQRALKRLAQDARKYAKDKKTIQMKSGGQSNFDSQVTEPLRNSTSNAESPEANTYDWHRKVRLAREARAYNLIRAYLKGIPYKQVEQSLKPTTIMPYLAIEHSSTMVSLYGDLGGIYDWLEAE